MILFPLIFISCGSKNDDTNRDRPTVLTILIDNAGYADFGFQGSAEIQTPDLDATVA